VWPWVTHFQGRDTPKGQLHLEDPCWGSDTARRTIAGEPCQGRGILRSKKEQRKINKKQGAAERNY